MKMSNIISSITMGAGRALVKVKAHSPEILLVIGVGGVIAGTVVACKATLKAHTIMEEANTSLKEIHDCEADEGLADKYTEEDARNDKVNLFIKTAVKLTGLYAPSILLCGCSIACILLSHKIMSDQKAAAIAFGNTAAAALAEYRNQIAEKYGKDADESIRYGLNKKKTVDPESYSDTDGSGEVKEKEETCAELGDASQYAMLIDSSCDIWDRSTDLTMMALHSALRHLNDKLAARQTGKRPGYLILAEALDYIGVPREMWPKDAMIVGWLYDKKNPKLHNFVDFGPMYLLAKREGGYYIRDGQDENSYSSERAVIIDPNVDGIIYDKI